MTRFCCIIWLFSFAVWGGSRLVDSVPAMHGEVQSPQYPRPYPPNLMRQWDLWVPEGFQIQLTLKHLDIKTSDGCHQDSLTVLYDQKVLGKFCGQGSSSNHPSKKPILSPGNRLTLIFQTSDSTPEQQQHIGFSATHKAIATHCGEPEPLLNGRVTFLSGSQNQYLSVIQYHCNEPFYYLAGDINATFTCQADGKWKSNHNSDVTPTCIPVCGQPTKSIVVYQRIIGGSDAPDNTIPWQVMLNLGRARGGGMIIADRWIMTAASVVSIRGVTASNDTVKIYTGVTDIKRDMSSPVYAASVHVHPQYNNDVDYNNDIALIKLRDPITFNSSVMPVCLPAAGATYQTGTMGLVSGFGITKADDWRVMSIKLKYVYIPLVDQETCTNSVNLMRRNDRTGLTNNMFCAGLPEGGKDSCSGDSGGPFVLSDSGRYWAAGIVSWGFDCGQQGTYGVYTKVTNYLNWIHKTMQEN
ncbi:complement C1r subcomponent-like [Anabas testudineus]|uniref:complement C1r subcomponent-like n=1 Tax=Anabas testudineus TaxID=64144 RepID=UPI000E457214|nr:complement C1r subcomponent-like [Anabas testudineus]